MGRHIDSDMLEMYRVDTKSVMADATTWSAVAATNSASPVWHHVSKAELLIGQKLTSTAQGNDVYVTPSAKPICFVLPTIAFIKSSMVSRLTTLRSRPRGWITLFASFARPTTVHTLWASDIAKEAELVKCAVTVSAVSLY